MKANKDIIWIIRNQERRRVTIIDYDNDGKQNDRAGWATKKELISYLRSFGYTVKRNGEVWGDGIWTMHKIIV